jgi:two-component system, NtrC family, sensor kinase
MTVRTPEKPDAAALLVRLDALRQAERRAASARMVSVAGHLIGTPLNVIAGRAALIRSNLTPEAVEENVRRIEEQVERLAMRIRRLIDYFGMAEPTAARRSLGEVLDECAALYCPIAEAAGVTLHVSPQGLEPLQLEASVPPLVLTTLLSLAVRSTSAGQTIRLTALEHGPKSVIFEMTLPGLPAPPASFERLEPPEHSLRYDAGALETFWICLGLARRIGGGLALEKADAPVGVTARFECPHD